MNTFRTAVRNQGIVVWALMLRETKTLFGKHKLGYLWAPINVAYGIGIFWFIRDYAGFEPPPGLSTPTFLIGGFIPFYLFSEMVTGGMNAIGGNKALLTYPQVQPLDLLIARALLNGAMYFCVMVFLLVVAKFMGYLVDIPHPEIMLLALLLAVLLGFGTGCLCSALNLMWPTTNRIVPMIVRALFYVSGLFFSIEAAPSGAQNTLFFNPISHLIEFLRSSFIPDHLSRFVYLPYVVGWIVVTLALGLFLERYSRNYLDRI
ncbi:MAG: ABC transporter permease [Deltaproteobacteria bacterium]|nr:ABC transporter permease [Deltaproteobacteria bacterium]